MGDRRLRMRIIAALGGVVAVAVMLGGGTALAASRAVTIADLAFAPPAVTVSVGETVTWTNNDPQVHTATADDGSWSAGNIAGNGGIGAVVYSKAGTFPYHCEIHPQMTGTVTVVAAAGPSASVAGTTMRPTDADPISSAGGDTGVGLVPSLAIAALAMAVAAAVMRRPPNPSISRAVTIVSTAGDTAIPSKAVVPMPGAMRRGDGALAPFVIGGVALVVAIALIGRRLTSRR